MNGTATTRAIQLSRPGSAKSCLASDSAKRRVEISELSGDLPGREPSVWLSAYHRHAERRASTRAGFPGLFQRVREIESEGSHTLQRACLVLQARALRRIRAAE